MKNAEQRLLGFRSHAGRLAAIALGLSSLVISIGCTGIDRHGAGPNGSGSGGSSWGDGGPDLSGVAPRDATMVSDLIQPGDDANCSHDIQAVIRDFRGYTGPNGEPRHPDFEGATGSLKGIVQDMLGADSKPVYAPAGATRVTAGPTEFDQWYRDVAGVNVRIDGITLPLTPSATNPALFGFNNQAFFPINGMGFDEGMPATTNNFHFTTEIHIEFPYRGGEVLTFEGDDDLFLFINGHLAIDLGGVHSAQQGMVDLDAQAGAFGIQLGQTYRMDIFHAERHTVESHFRLETTLGCFKSIIIP